MLAFSPAARGSHPRSVDFVTEESLLAGRNAGTYAIKGSLKRHDCPLGDISCVPHTISPVGHISCVSCPQTLQHVRRLRE